MIAPQFKRALGLACFAFALCGCGDAGPRRTAIRGTVSLDGQPVNQATLILTPTAQGLAAAATIHHGVFELPADVGPTVGEFGVRINPLEAETEGLSDSRGLSRAKARPRIPKIYQREGALSVKITGEADQSLAIELSSKQR
jgi:hypothetical protein